ncbi:hypothetical protein K353_05852 [Kitasatospora sp. SolWspMP-SS2h]|uniref:hypothetical protein n=1 Tax=Kitasatospora sp. SolWspMP-SS2h TaxID=1305729 RepID=UPI000DB9E771|nr:hypothetical protein [Kitasatospora sp. SolWspMP-SS2h]RAJ32854.1 hypothetical protein K353_05852 [Kitasatospora sp. SolWspMP-SS2h]
MSDPREQHDEPVAAVSVAELAALAGDRVHTEHPESLARPAAAQAAVTGFAGFLAARDLLPAARKDVDKSVEAVDYECFRDLLGRLAYADPAGPGRLHRLHLPDGGLLLDDTNSCSLADMLAATEGLPLHADRHRELCAIVTELEVGADQHPIDVHARVGTALATAGIRHLAVIAPDPGESHYGPPVGRRDARVLLTAARQGGVEHTELLCDTGPALDRFAAALPAGCAVLVKGFGLAPLLPYLAAHFAARTAGT